MSSKVVIRISRSVGRAGLLVAAFGLGLAAAGAASAQASESPADRLVRACTPELVYSFRPGKMDASGSGSGFAPNLRYTDAAGNPLPQSTATVDWSARAVVDEPERDTGVRPNIGGYLEIALATAAGERLIFKATCIAAVIGIPPGVGVWANGIVTGWPGSEARRAFVHFEGYSDGSAYVALIDGSDCKLNFDALVVTDEPYISGTASFSGLPTRFVGAETSCANRFGEPLPALRAPGLIKP